MVEQRRHFVDQRTAMINQIQAALKNYYPQALDILGESLDTPMGSAFLLKWPDLASLQKARTSAVRDFFYAHHARRPDLIEKRIAAIAAAVPLTTDVAVVDAGRLTVQGLARILRPILQTIKAFDQQIKTEFDAHPDAPIFAALPGAATAMAPRLLAALGSDRSRFANAAELQIYSGIAPIVERSGGKSWTHHRWACPKFLRQTFHEYAGCSLRKSRWAQAYYDMKIAHGSKHHAILRALAFKWIRIIVACWKQRQPYDEARYLQRLRRKGSPLLAYIQPPAPAAADAQAATTAPQA